MRKFIETCGTITNRVHTSPSLLMTSLWVKGTVYGEQSSSQRVRRTVVECVCVCVFIRGRWWFARKRDTDVMQTLSKPEAKKKEKRERENSLRFNTSPLNDGDNIDDVRAQNFPRTRTYVYPHTHSTQKPWYKYDNTVRITSNRHCRLRRSLPGSGSRQHL